MDNSDGLVAAYRPRINQHGDSHECIYNIISKIFLSGFFSILQIASPSHTGATYFKFNVTTICLNKIFIIIYDFKIRLVKVNYSEFSRTFSSVFKVRILPLDHFF